MSTPTEQPTVLWEPTEEQRERATSAAIPGVGLGLAIAQAIVHGHDGEIGVQSADGEGTTFRIELPLHRSAEVTA